jgi:hypothetical protein
MAQETKIPRFRHYSNYTSWAKKHHRDAMSREDWEKSKEKSPKAKETEEIPRFHHYSNYKAWTIKNGKKAMSREDWEKNKKETPPKEKPKYDKKPKFTHYSDYYYWARKHNIRPLTYKAFHKKLDAWKKKHLIKPGTKPSPDSSPEKNRGYRPGDVIPKGTELFQLEQYDPEQYERYAEAHRDIDPNSDLYKLAHGDEELLRRGEEPAWRDYQKAQGLLGSRFAEFAPGAMSATKGTGFENASSALQKEFLENQQKERQRIQREAESDLNRYRHELLGERPVERGLYQEPQKPPKYRESPNSQRKTDKGPSTFEKVVDTGTAILKTVPVIGDAYNALSTGFKNTKGSATKI